MKCVTCGTEMNPHTGCCPWYCGDGKPHVITPLPKAKETK
jgi:hypothetical protein